MSKLFLQVKVCSAMAMLLEFLAFLYFLVGENDTKFCLRKPEGDKCGPREKTMLSMMDDEKKPSGAVIIAFTLAVCAFIFCGIAFGLSFKAKPQVPVIKSGYGMIIFFLFHALICNLIYYTYMSQYLFAFLNGNNVYLTPAFGWGAVVNIVAMLFILAGMAGAFQAGKAV